MNPKPDLLRALGIAKRCGKDYTTLAWVAGSNLWID
jgi:hypothetical protein